MGSVIDGDCHVTGALTMGSVTLPTNSVTANKIAAGAGIEATKLEQRMRQPWAQGDYDDTAVDGRFVLHVVTGATGTIREFKAGCVTPCVGTDTIAVDLLKNGTSVLSADITLSSSETARELVEAAISTMAVAADDVLEVDIVVSHSTGTMGIGIFGTMVIDEDAQ